jgi:hypothetical protein
MCTTKHGLKNTSVHVALLLEQAGKNPVLLEAMFPVLRAGW